MIVIKHQISRVIKNSYLKRERHWANMLSHNHLDKVFWNKKF